MLRFSRTPQNLTSFEFHYEAHFNPYVGEKQTKRHFIVLQPMAAQRIRLPWQSLARA